MKILNIKQNSEEWLEYRKGKSGGSEFKDLWIPGLPLKNKIIEFLEKDGQALSPADKRSSVPELAAMLEPEELAILKLESDPKRKYYELIASEVARDLTPNDYVDRLNGRPFSPMERGHILENEALDAFAEQMGHPDEFLINKEPGVWESDYNPNIYISPDGAVENSKGEILAAIEVKCLASWEIIKAWKTKQYPQEYEPQVIKYFVVNEKLEKLYFLLYTDLIPGLELQVFEINRADVADRITDAKAFENEVMRRVAQDIEQIKELGF